MRRSLTRATMLSVLLVIVGGWVGSATAGLILDTPAGLAPGAQFRIVFVTTDKVDAISSDISTYDHFVQAQAAGATYNGVTVNWQAIGSTAGVNAIDHIGQSEVPVYLVTGTRVTTSTTASGLWSGRLEHAIDRDIYGGEQTQWVWTGTQANGEKRLTSSGDYDTSTALGGLWVQVGSSAEQSYKWTVSTNISSTGGPLPRLQLYGISEVLRVPSAPPAPPIPEPAGVLLLGVGGGLALGRRWYRQHRARPTLTAEGGRSAG